MTVTVVIAEDRDDETVASHVYKKVPGVLALTVSTLVLVALFRSKVTMLAPTPLVRKVVPLRHANTFLVLTLLGTDAVQTMLKELYCAASSTITVDG